MSRHQSNSNSSWKCTWFPVIVVGAMIMTTIYVSMSNAPATTSSSGSIRRADTLKAVGSSDKYKATALPGVDLESSVKEINSKIFDGMIKVAQEHPRKRKMADLTKNPADNSLQVLINTWSNGSYAPVHRHDEYSEAFIILKGALAFFTFTDEGVPTCHVLNDVVPESVRAIIVEKKQWHGMTAAPPEMGWPGYAVVFENSGHKFDASKSGKTLAPFAPEFEDNQNGNPQYYHEKLLHLCPRKV